MNNVWTAIAFRAPCASRKARPRPLLELFNGYSRYHTTPRFLAPRTRYESSTPLCQATLRPEREQCPTRTALNLRCEFATSSWLLAKKKKKVSKVESTRPPSASKLEPAPTVATHTEGAPDEGGVLTWRDYDPEGGMPLPGGERTQPQINSIFGSEKIDAETGNYILNVVYWRRMSGALIDVGLAFPKDSGVTQEEALQALNYVRSLNPGLDEQAAGQVWAEEESLRLQNELQERAVKLRLYKPADAEPEDFEQEPEEEQGTARGRARNRESQLRLIREENKAKFEAEKARRADAEAKAELAAAHSHRGPLQLGGGVQPAVELVTYTGRDGIAISRPQTKAWLQPVERKPWVRYYEKQAETFQENTIPQLSLIRRLGPSLLVLLLVFGAGIYLTENYTPPSESARLWPNVRPAVATLAALTGTMTAFFILSRMPPFWRTLNKYFTLVPVYPYALSLIGSAFRHDPSHLLINMSSLWLFGLILHDDIGRGAFLSVFFAAGALGAYSSLTYHVLQKAWGTYIFGSSGCVLGVVAAATTLRPNSHIKVFGQEIPVAVWLWLSVWAVAEVIAMRRFKGSIDHVGHLGGLLGGFGAGMWLRQRRKRLETPVNQETAGHVMKAVS